MACLAAWLWAVGTAAVAAQDVGSDETQPKATPQPKGEQPPEKPLDDPPRPPPTVVVHLDTGGDDALLLPLREALEAQFASVPVRVYTLTDGSPPTDMPQRMRAGRAAATKYGAFAVFWIGARPGEAWLVYMMDPAGDRLLARELPTEEDSSNASGEAAAVIVAGATGALLRGEPVELRIASMPEPVEETPPTPEPDPVKPVEPPLPPPPPAQPLPPPAPSSRFQVWLGYHGQAVAPELGWQHGLAAQVGVEALEGLWLSLAYIDAMTETIDGPVPFELYRTMGRLSVTYLIQLGEMAIGPEAAVLIDVPRRHSLPGDGTLSPQADETRILWGLEPALVLEIALGPDTNLRTRLAAEIILNNFKYISKDPEPRVRLAPRRVQPSIEVGLSLNF